MAHVKLTLEDLEKAGACEDGMAEFKSILPDGIDCDWTEQHAAVASYLFGVYYDWAVNDGVGLIPRLPYEPIVIADESSPDDFQGIQGKLVGRMGQDDWPCGYGDWGYGNDWFVPNYLCGSDYTGGFVCKSNYDEFCEEFADGDGQWWCAVSGGYSTYAIVLATRSTPKKALEFLSALEDYPVANEDRMSDMELKAENEAWESWAKRDFRKELERRYAELAELDEYDIDLSECEERSELYTVFHETCDRINHCWEAQGDQPEVWIDVDKIAAACTLEDIGRIIFGDES
jgi:hypothetical protein